MANIPIEEIKRLREMTGVGITDAKAALIENGGDFAKALADMKKKGLTSAAKRAGKEAKAGSIGSYVHDRRIGVLVEVNCETDFVAKTDEFNDLVKELTLHIAAADPADIDELLSQPYIREVEKTIGDLVKEHAAKLNENIVVRRFERLQLGEMET